MYDGIGGFTWSFYSVLAWRTKAIIDYHLAIIIMTRLTDMWCPYLTSCFLFCFEYTIRVLLVHCKLPYFSVLMHYALKIASVSALRESLTV